MARENDYCEHLGEIWPILRDMEVKQSTLYSPADKKVLQISFIFTKNVIPPMKIFPNEFQFYKGPIGKSGRVLIAIRLGVYDALAVPHLSAVVLKLYFS